LLETLEQTMEDATSSALAMKTPFPVKKRTKRSANPGCSWFTRQIVEPVQAPQKFQTITAGRSRRPRKHSTWYSNENFMSTVSDEFEWSTFYPDTPYTPEPPVTVESAGGGYVNGDDVGNMVKHFNNQLGTWVLGDEVITLSSDSSSDTEHFADVQKPRKAQRTGPSSRKARRISFTPDPTVTPLAVRGAQIVVPEVEILDEGIRSDIIPQLRGLEAKQRHLRKILDAIIGVRGRGIGQSGAISAIFNFWLLCRVMDNGPIFSVFLLSEEE
jgi:hypothetical protein